MDIGSLDSFLFRYTESELRHRGEPPDVLSPRYRRIPQVNFAGRDMYLFSFNSLMEGRSICVNKESRFTFIPEHIHTVIEFLYVYAGHCTQVIDGRRVEMSAGDICLLETIFLSMRCRRTLLTTSICCSAGAVTTPSIRSCKISSVNITIPSCAATRL